MAVVLALDCVTVITPLVAGSAALVVLATETVAVSLSASVLVATSVAPSVANPEVTPVIVTITVSAPSTIASSIVGMLITAVVEPAGMVTVPERAVKSEPEVAVPETV